jgi:N-acylneuraminate cytidylyltransferase/CMP-N,N'-diacetyllegionaminic acid synthase
MNILCVIPARGGSKGLKDKNIIPFCGRPLIEYTIKAALDSKAIDRVAVSTECRKIARISSKAGVEIVDRPKNLAKDSSAIEDSLRHAVEYLRRLDGYLPEIVVMLQANVPIRKKGQIDKVIDRLKAGNADSAVTAYCVDQHPQWMKRMDRNGYLHPLFPGAKNFRRQDVEPYYMLDGAVVAIRRKVLMRTKGKKGVHLFMGKKTVAIVQDKKYSIEIDKKEDLELARFILRG